MIDVVHVILIGTASREALNEIGEPIALKKLLQVAKIRAGAPSVERERMKLLVSCRERVAAYG